MNQSNKQVSRGHFVGADYHKRLLGDGVRMDAFAAAIQELVRPGMAVADVGTGTGILAFLARRAGARVVYAIEPAPIVRMARRCAQASGLDGIVFLEADSLTTTLPEPVDLVISECMGNFVITDEMLPVLADLRRHLAPGGLLCPASIQLHLAPARLLAFSEIAYWDHPIAGFDFSPMRQAALSRAYVLHTYPEDLIGPAQPFLTIDPHTLDPGSTTTITGEVRLPLTAPGPLTGVVGWFDAQLSPSVTLSTAPGINTHWGQMLFPLRRLPLEPGDELRFALSLFVEPDSATFSWQWEGELFRQGQSLACSRHSTSLPWGSPYGAVP